MTSFGRRTWDRAEYAALERATHDQASSKFDELTSDELSLLKSKFSDHKTLIESVTQDSNRRVLTTGASTYKKGKQFGFYCDLCDLTFKDTLQYVNHLNHKSHQIKFENVFGEPLIYDTRDDEEVPRQEFEQCYERIVDDFLKKAQVRTRTPKKKSLRPAPKTNAASEAAPGVSSSVAGVMGFQGFGSTKKS
ncbi:LAMI_0E02146g1_1 [Lachancea mirantina]|uniref:LAMI_0E02146g1_1 n=1 Tax=Lachancea mirantina TaxID=1230905 RepID=A0A1G4JJT2_9SACH|nr:LAMI_0E02146g1_1 [Lachancea mirantina]